MSDTAKFRTTVDRDTNPLTTDEDESDELFSDDEQKKQIQCKSNASLDVPILYRSETPVSVIDDSSAISITPSNAIIPSTPLSLVPFLNKINDQWTSDLETPQADKSAQTYTRPLTSATRNTEETSKLEQCTPEISVRDMDSKISSSSPVIVSRRKGKLPKRRCIFRSSISTDTPIVTSNEHITVNIHAEAPLTPKNTDSIVQDEANVAAWSPPVIDTCEIHESQVLNTIRDTFNSEELDKFRNTAVDSSNSSSYDLFTVEEVLPKTKLQFIEQSETYDEIKDHIKDHKKTFVSDSLVQEIGIPSSSFSTGNGAPINFSRDAWTKALFLLTDELHKDDGDDDDNIQRQYEKLSTRKNCITVHNMMLSSSLITPNNIPEKSSVKEEKFTEQLNDPIEAASRVDTYVDNQCDTKTSNIGFKTARGVPVNISEQAFSKAKILLTDDLEKSIHPNLSREANIYNKEVKRQEVKFSNIRFQTGRGAPINISEKALSKAKRLLGEELDKPLEGITKEDNTYNEEGKRKEIEILNVGFQTGRGATINISEQALSNAKTLLGKELDIPLEPRDAKEEDNIYNEEDKNKEIKIPNVRFRTGRGAPINISEQALSKAKILLEEKLDKPLEPVIAKENNIYNEEDKRIEIKVPNVGFRTGHGAPINISEQALSKAKILLEEKLDKPLEPAIAKEDNIYNKEDKRKEIKIPNVGFRTGHGAPINISEQALSKAKILLEEKLDKPLEPAIAKEDNIYNKEDKRKEIKIPNVGFRTGHGAPINISEKALSKAKILLEEKLDKPLEPAIVEEDNIYDEEVKEQEMNVLNITFQTGRGIPISISEEALSKAKMLFAKELDKSLQQNVVKETNDCNKEVESKVEIPNIGFRTGRGTSINISEHALSKAKVLFATELDKPLGPRDAEGINTYNNEVQKQEVKTSNIEFRTARGASINISDQALCKANILLAEHLNYPLGMDISENIGSDNEKAKRHNTTISHCEFQTAGDQQATISSNALLKLTVSSNDRLNKNTSDLTSCASFQKRKLISDETTPLGRISASGLKKARLSDECEDTKLSSGNPGVDIINYGKVDSEDIYITNNMPMDEDMDGNRNTETSCVAVSVNTAEFDPNKEKQVDTTAGSTLGSPKRDASSESIESNTIGSPVIGRQFASKNRKSLGQRIDVRHRIQESDKMILDNAYVTTQEKIVRENASCEKTENKLNAELRESLSIRTKRQNIEKNLSNTESTEYGDTQVMMDFIDESAQILRDRLAAALVQENVITTKRRHRSKQITGSLYRYKHTNSNTRSSLREISNGVPPLPRSYQELIDQRIPPNILAITATTAALYKFRCSHFYGTDFARTNIDGIEMEDGARLIMDENGYVGVWEFLRAFLASPGVEPNLVPARWIENHYRWIVWKLASMDRMKFGSTELPRALTPSHVMAQLKYRYDREIDRSQRPAVRRILEKDDVASKRMILCVSSIAQNNNIATEIGKSPCAGVLKWKMDLTDGWYSIPACIDMGMMKNISTGKVKEGTKLVVYGAELLNCDEGCYPLEASPDVCLKLHTNSTRRARWDSKLGYASHSGPILIRLRDVCPSGGLIGKITVIVARVYPMLYYERIASGESIVRNAKCEEKMQIEYEQQCRSKIEAFYAKAEKDFQDLSCGTDSMDMLAAQSSKNREGLYTQEEKFKQELQSKLRESLPAPRQVSLLLKVRVCDGDANAILSIWSPSEEIVDGIKEGACVSFRNIVASGKRGCELQLTARRSTILNPGIMQDTSYPSRTCTLLWKIGNSEFSPPYGEFDTVGFVCSVGPAPYGMKDFEVVHLAYPNTDSNNSSYISILFWQGIASFGYIDILTIGSIVACNNLEWRRATSWNVPVAYCTDRSTFTRNPRRNHLYESFESLRNLITDPDTYANKCSSELNIELQKKPTTRTPTRYTPGKNTPNKIYNSASSSDKKLVGYASPLSTPKLGAATSKDFVAANSSIQKRFNKLQYYGEPPELSPITIKSSKRVSLDFQLPVFISDMSSAKDMSSTHKSGHSDLSIAPEKQ